MANISALGSGPVSFLDGNGKQYSIPLMFISYPSATGAPAVASNWPGWGAAPALAEQSVVNNWVGLLGTLGFMEPAPLPPALPSFIITANTPGVAGNAITVEFVSQDTSGNLTVTVSTTQTYTGLTYTGTPTSTLIQTVLGSATSSSTQPLAYVSADSTTLPTATSGPVAFAAPSAGANYVFDFGTHGELTANYQPTNSDAQYLSASISNVNSTAESFDLTLSWSKTVTGLTPATLGAAFSYLINVAPPPGGTYGTNPTVPSTIVLVGGAAASGSAAPIAASATVISS